MKKIAFVFDGLEQGGIERIGVDYVRMCRELGYEVDVYNLAPKHYVTAQFLPKDVEVFIKPFSKYLCPEFYIKLVQKYWWGKYAYSFISPIISFIQFFYKLLSKKRKYDYAIAIAGHVPDISFITKNFIKSKVKITWCHGSILSYYSMSSAYSYLYKKIDRFVVLSSVGQKDIYVGNRYMFDKKIFKIYNPTYFSINKCDSTNIKQYKKLYKDYILMVGRFEFGKCQDVAIKVIKELKNRGLEKNIVFIGDGSTITTMKNLAKAEGVENLCIFTGYQSNVQDYIAASYINILLSRWEGLPTVIIEAMTIGKPCVMNSCDDGEVSGNGKYCKLVNLENVDSIADNLYELYTDKKVYKKYQQLSLDRAKDFTPETVKFKLQELLS